MRIPLRFWLPASIAFALAACGGGTEPAETRTLAKLAGDNQAGVAGLAVTTAPSVKVTNQNNQGVAGIAVTFAVASGGGSVTGATVTTGSDGVAAVGSWTLGTTAGANTLTATAAGITGSPVTFTVTGSAGAPKTVTKQPGTDNQNANAGEAVAVKPAVKVVDQFGNPVAGVTVTFAIATGGGTVAGGSATTGADGVATVGNWFVGGAAGANTLTATVTGAGITGNPATFTATAVLLAFNPSANTSLSGTKSYSSVNIPAGVTVTMSGDLVLNVSGAVTIAGTLTGDCVALTINADGALTVSGTINNGCPGAIPAGGPPAMLLVGKGGWTLNGPGGFTAGGDVTITDDPTATDADFNPAPTPGAGLRANRPPAAVGTPCNVGANFTGTANPATTANGADGNPNGADALRDGATWVLRCKGGPDIVISNISLTGQNGGRGGNGTHNHASAAVSRGGKGAKGGTVKIQAFGSIALGGGTIRTGSGGAGGSATATGTGGGGNVGASADATGGIGAAPGLFGAFAKTGGISISGALTLQIGVAGKGGDATAAGGDGHHAEPCPPAVGGPATATGGLDGTTPDKQLNAAGAVVGLGNVTVTGGTPGNGGDAVATAGKGGNGAKACKPGAVGGDPTAKGGTGGDGNLKNQAGTKIANGGNGGKMEDRDGKGGHGYVDCVAPWDPGGPGGAGGTSRGFNGTAGTGFVTGTYGAAIFNVVSNGGDGGDGFGPGAGGAAGGNSALLINVAATIIAPSFQPGIPGNICIGTSTKSFIVSPPTSDLSGHEPVLQQAGTRAGSVTVGANTMSIDGLIKNSTIQLTGSRTGANVSLSGTGVINTGSGPRNVTITFNGSIGPNGLSGTMSILVSGFPNPAVYPVSDP